MAKDKRIKTAREGIDPAKAYSLDEAVKLVKERAKAKFDETVEIAMNLGVDPRHADRMVRGRVAPPNGARVGGRAARPPARTAPPARSASRCARAAPRPTRRSPPAPT